MKKKKDWNKLLILSGFISAVSGLIGTISNFINAFSSKEDVFTKLETVNEGIAYSVETSFEWWWLVWLLFLIGGICVILFAIIKRNAKERKGEDYVEIK